MSETNLKALPSKGERQLVPETIKDVIEANFEEIVVLGFKNGKTYLFHSKLKDTVRLIGAIEQIKLRIMEK